MTTPQQAFDSDSGIDSRRELAQEWVSANIADVCERYADRCPFVEAGHREDCLSFAESDPLACAFYDDAVQARLQDMKDGDA